MTFFDITAFINAFIGLFVVVDPIGNALIFHGLAGNASSAQRRRIALRVGVISCLLMIVFGNFGEPLLHKLGISIDAMRVAGGVLLFYTAFHMVTSSPEQQQAAAADQDIAVFPMTIPMTAGPGTLTLCILLYSGSNNTTETTVAITVAIALLCVFLVACLIFAQHVKRVIGKTGDDLLQRFLGVMLAALAVQFVFDGFANLFKQVISG